MKSTRSTGITIVVAAVVSLTGCSPSSPPGPPETPVLEAVLRAGTPPRFARRNAGSGVFEVLPAGATILRMASGYPGSSDRMRVSLTLADGARRDLAWVRSDDVATKQSFDQTGYYEIAIDNFGYSLIVTPAVAERSGTGFTIGVVNLSPNASESAPLQIVIGARSTVTQPNAVFSIAATITMRSREDTTGTAKTPTG